MTKYTLHYFGINGRGVVPRAILTYAKAHWMIKLHLIIGQK